MATIALNYSPIGQMSGFFEQIKTSISNYQSEILTIQNMSSAVDSTIYNLDDVISEVQTSTTLQDDKTAYIGTLDTQMQTFVDNAVSRDQQAAEEINASKDDFYERYEYLKPDIEKTGWEKFCEWSAENWKFWATVVLVVVAVVIIIVCTAATGGAFLAAIAPYSLVLLGIAKGILSNEKNEASALTLFFLLIFPFLKKRLCLTLKTKKSPRYSRRFLPFGYKKTKGIDWNVFLYYIKFLRKCKRQVIYPILNI